MAKETKKAVRAAFRKSVFERSKYKCECCGKSGYDRQLKSTDTNFPLSLVPLDAHHITNRK